MGIFTYFGATVLFLIHIRVYLYKQYKLITTGVKWNNPKFRNFSLESWERKKKLNMYLLVNVVDLAFRLLLENWERNDKDERDSAEIWWLSGGTRSSLAIGRPKDRNLITQFNAGCELQKILLDLWLRLERTRELLFPFDFLCHWNDQMSIIKALLKRKSHKARDKISSEALNWVFLRLQFWWKSFCARINFL